MSPAQVQDPNRDTEAPILLSARAQLLENNTAILDTVALQAPLRKPIVIDEIRFTASARTIAPTVGPVINWGGIIRAKFTLGRIALTRDFVPIWNFGTAMNTEVTFDPPFSQGPQFPNRTTYAHFRWKLPRELYVPAGQVLKCELYRDSNIPVIDTYTIENGLVTVDVAYSGRYLKPDAAVPQLLNVPYVSCYIPPLRELSPRSSEDELGNPFLVPLNVQRMIGRQQVSVSNDVIELPLVGNISLLQIRDSWGHNILNDWTTVNDVFPWPRRAWTFTRILQPKERYNVVFKDVGRGFTGTEFARPMISIVGWREEVLR